MRRLAPCQMFTNFQQLQLNHINCLMSRHQKSDSRLLLHRRCFPTSSLCSSPTFLSPMPQAALRPSSPAHHTPQGTANVSMEPGQVVKPTTHKVLHQVLGHFVWMSTSILLPQDTCSPLLLHQLNHLLLLLGTIHKNILLPSFFRQSPSQVTIYSL